MDILDKDKLETTVLETAVTGFMAFPFACAAAVAVGMVAPPYAIPALVVLESGAMAWGAHESVTHDRKCTLK